MKTGKTYVLDCEGVLTPSLTYKLREEIGMARIFNSLLSKDALIFVVYRMYDMLMRCIGSKKKKHEEI